MQGGAVYVEDGTLNLVGCKFSGNSATTVGNHIDKSHASTINIIGCPAGFFGAAEAALDNLVQGGAITGEAKSFSCGACVR